jgi:tRNA acetyltransferase TAN1
MINDFNLLATTSRGNERPMCNELHYLLKEQLGDAQAQVSKTKVRGLIVGKTTLDPCLVIEKFRAILKERPYEFRYALRILPIEKVVPTDLEEIKRATAELVRRKLSGLRLKNASLPYTQETLLRQRLEILTVKLTLKIQTESC